MYVLQTLDLIHIAFCKCLVLFGMKNALNTMF